MNVTHLVSTYGYWAVFAFVGMESLGVPLPGETALIAAAAYAGRTHHMSPWAIFAVAVAAAVTGDNAGYLIGRTGGFALAERYGSKVRLDERKLKVGRYVLDRHGGKVIFFGRFVSVLRTYIAFLAGTVHMRWPKFFLASALAVVIWSGAYTIAAYEAASALRRLSLTVELVLGALAVVAVLVTLFLTHRQLKLLGDRAEAAYPGPLR